MGEVTIIWKKQCLKHLFLEDLTVVQLVICWYILKGIFRKEIF